MKVTFRTEALQPMLDWLLTYKKTGERDEAALRSILSLPDYQIEFLRYGLEGLPVCGIGFEKAVDFFLHFDSKEFENPRLQSKKESFLKFFDELEDRIPNLGKYAAVTREDQEVIENLLKQGLPEQLLQEIDELSILLIVSIGNSMGWPYEHYVDFDASNMHLFGNAEDFLHVVAHEIHHILLGNLLACDGIRSEDFFLQNFAYEGLAVHFNNNQETLMKPKKYPGKTYMMEASDMDFYAAHFDEIFAMIRADYQAAKGMTLEEAAGMVSSHYERFEFMGKPVMQYPTYYFGCYMWGLVDLVYGKEKLFEAIANPPLFVELYNRAAKEAYRL